MLPAAVLPSFLRSHVCFYVKNVPHKLSMYKATRECLEALSNRLEYVLLYFIHERFLKKRPVARPSTSYDEYNKKAGAIP